MRSAYSLSDELPSRAFETACPSCDLLVQIPALAPGSRANCGRCGHLLTSHNRHGFERAAAFGLSALILLLVACSFPFMSFERAGFMNEMTLPAAGFLLFQDGAVLLSVLVFGFILTVPTILLVVLLLLIYALKKGRRWQSLPLLGRMLTQLQPWSMVEVFVIGVIVSLVKLAAMANIVLGIAFWAYVGFALCFTAAFSSLDQHDLWDAIEDVTP
ncbi:MAG: paraquat-inducible protein A [Pseudomonadales bacterium]